MKRYIIRQGVTGYQIGQLYATQESAEKAAKRYSLQSMYLGQTLSVFWRNDFGSDKREVALAYRGAIERTTESPIG